jgi:hypothetical protein
MRHVLLLDSQVVNCNIGAERNPMRVGDHFIRVLTINEAIMETRLLALDALLKALANSQFLCSDSAKAPLLQLKW